MRQVRIGASRTVTILLLAIDLTVTLLCYDQYKSSDSFVFAFWTVPRKGLTQIAGVIRGYPPIPRKPCLLPYTSNILEEVKNEPGRDGV